MNLEEDNKRDFGVYVLIYRDENNGGLDIAERETKKDITDLIAKLGGPDIIVKLYAGAKERKIKKVVSYTF